MEEVREEAERERREMQRTYEARLAEEQRARMEDKEALDETIEHKDRDKRRAEEAMQAMAAERDEQHTQLVTLQADKKDGRPPLSSATTAAQPVAGAARRRTTAAE